MHPFASFFLLWFEISGICSMTFFTVTMFTSNDVIVFSFFDHHNFINTTLARSGDTSKGQIDLISASLALTSGGEIVLTRVEIK